MLRHQLGEAVFWRAVAKYLNDHRWRGVETGDLRRALEEASGRDLEQFFQQWVYGRGVPRLEVGYAWELTRKRARVSVRQTQKIDKETPAFAFPLDLHFRLGDEAKDVTVNVTEGRHEFTFDFASEPAIVSVDPRGGQLKTLVLKVPRGMLIKQAEGGPTALSRLMTVEELSKQSHPEAVAALERALKKGSEFWGVRSAAAEGLGKMQTEPALRALLRAEKGGLKQPRVLAALLRGLGGHPVSPEAHAAVLKYTRGQKSLDVETAAVSALAQEPVPTRAERDSASSEAPPREQAQQTKVQQRLERYREARERHGQGQSIRQIAQEMGLSRKAVRRYLRQDNCPDWRPGQPRRTQLARHQEWIDGQLLAGRDNAAQLHQELTERGYEGCYDAVRRFVTRRLAALGKKRQRANAATCKHPPAPSARELAFGVLRQPEQRKPEEQARVDILRGINEEFREVLTLAEELAAMLRKQSAPSLQQWLAKAAACASPDMNGFAQGIRQDEAAVAAAMSEPWSNGPVEGQVNRLKTIKRQMYGRAGFQLLRTRVLDAG
jgi:transposase